MTKYLLLNLLGYEKPKVLSFTSSHIELNNALFNNKLEKDEFDSPDNYKQHRVRHLSKNYGSYFNNSYTINAYRLYDLNVSKNDIVALTVNGCGNNEVLTGSDNKELMEEVCKTLWFLHPEDKEKLMDQCEIFDLFDQVIIGCDEKFADDGDDVFLEIKILRGDMKYHSTSFKITI